VSYGFVGDMVEPERAARMVRGMFLLRLRSVVAATTQCFCCDYAAGFHTNAGPSPGGDGLTYETNAHR